MKTLVVIAFGLGLVLVLAACVPFSGSNDKAPKPDGKNLLCVALPAEEIDFTVLNDIYDLVKQNSVFRETADDPRTLLRGGITAVFQQLGVEESRIPSWVWDEIDAQVATGQIDFTVLQRIFERLRDDPAYQKDPAYQDFRNPELAREFFRSAIDGVIRKGLKDPFASYIDAEGYRLGQTDISGQYQGVGLRHNLEDGHFKITEVFPGSPGEKAGLEAGDEIVAIDGKSLQGCSGFAFSAAVRGRAGTAVLFTIQHRDGTVEDMRVVRDVIQTSVISSCPGYNFSDGRGKSDRTVKVYCPLKDENGNTISDIIYIKFAEFNEVAMYDLAAVLRQADILHAKGLILDLRGNPGGSVAVLMQTLDYFFADDRVFKTTDWADGSYTEYRYDRFDYATDIPMVVLVGRDPYADSQGAHNNSYSAAEGFSGTVQDWGRATIIGESHTGGKGTTNQYFSLRNGKAGALYLAIGLWKTPQGRTVQGEDLDGDGYEDTGGIVPDIVVQWTDDDYAAQIRDSQWDPVLFQAIRTLHEIQR